MKVMKNGETIEQFKVKEDTTLSKITLNSRQLEIILKGIDENIWTNRSNLRKAIMPESHLADLVEEFRNEIVELESLKQHILDNREVVRLWDI